MKVWIATATYVDNEIEPITVAAYTSADAARELEAVLIDNEGPRGFWIQGQPIELPVLGTKPPAACESFDEEDKQSIYAMVREQVRDDVDCYAEIEMDSLSHVECLAYLDGDPEETFKVLKELMSPDATLRTTSVGDDDLINSFLLKHKLVDETTRKLTMLGEEYYNELG